MSHVLRFARALASSARDAARVALCLLLVLPALLAPLPASAQRGGAPASAPPEEVAAPPGGFEGGQPSGRTYEPASQSVQMFAPVNVREAAHQEALGPAQIEQAEIRAIDPPRGRPDIAFGVPINLGDEQETAAPGDAQAPLPSASGPSPGPTKTFKGEFLSSTSIPPDTMGAVGTTHVVTVSNNQMRITDRNGVQLQRMTLTSFWSGVTIKGAAVSAFDPKILYDRFNQRYIFVSSFNGQSVNSGAGVAVSQTNDPTGAWNRYAIVADPASTAAGGRWIDFPSLGFNKNWIVLNENTFGFGTAGGGFLRADVFVLDKQAAYAGTLSTVSAFQGAFSTCLASATPETELGCGFTMAPNIGEDNTTDTLYLVEDWDSQAGQLRLSKITGTPSTPVLTVGTQFPQSPFSWKFNANRVNGAAGSGGYIPERQNNGYAPSGVRVMGNDSRIGNAVLRNGTLWTAHHVMIAATPTAAGVGYSTTNPDIRTAIQWWQIDPTIENSATGTPPLQRARIEDPTADNCNSSNTQSGNSTERAGCTSANQTGAFFAYASIAVNQNNDALIGFSQFSALTYPNAAYAMRLAADAPNTTRDPVVYRPGQVRYDLASGATTATVQTRWGDYSAAMVDPVDDNKFWTVQEYGGAMRNDFVVGTFRSPWETWWAQVDPAAGAPSPTGNLIITEFRLRGPNGAQDEFIELYNPSTTTPVIVRATDGSEGWAVGFDNGTTTPPLAVIPNGTVIKPRGHFLVTNNPEGTDPDTATYSLKAYPGVSNPATQIRGADSDTGQHNDTADNQGVAVFRTTTRANFSLATRIDAAGFSTLAAGSLYKEGNGIPAITATTPTGQVTFHRNESSGSPQDTNANENDFIFADTAATTESFGVQPVLGAPGPENLDGPRVNNNIFVDRFDQSAGVSSPPNRVRDTTPGPPATSNLGTLSFRRRVTNLTGAPVTRLRFRIRQITTFPPPAGTADLRAISSGDITVNGLPVKGTILEEPPTQSTNGGGWNTTWSLPLASPLAAGAFVDVQYVVGVMQGGSFSIFINVEALP